MLVEWRLARPRGCRNRSLFFGRAAESPAGRASGGSMTLGPPAMDDFQIPKADDSMLPDAACTEQRIAPCGDTIAAERVALATRRVRLQLNSSCAPPRPWPRYPAARPCG